MRYRNKCQEHFVQRLNLNKYRVLCEALLYSVSTGIQNIPGVDKPRWNKLCTESPNICWSAARKLLHVAIMMRRTLRLIPHLYKTCAALSYAFILACPFCVILITEICRFAKQLKKVLEMTNNMH
jgi:hypothetical protein